MVGGMRATTGSGLIKSNRAMHFTQVDCHAYYPLCLLPRSSSATIDE
jgi:hypothetical protein